MTTTVRITTGRIGRIVAAALGLCGVASGLVSLDCSRQGDAGKPSSVPPLEGVAVPQAPSPVAPSPAPPAPPPPSPAVPAAPAAAPDPKATISGQIVVPAALSKSRPKGTLYLVARRLSDNPSARGTLIAVKKLPATSFPLAFTLGAADMPFQNGPFDGELALTARIDQDGDPMSHQKGDLFGGLPKVRVGSRDVKLTLDQLQKENESLGQPGPGMGGGALPPGHPQ